MLGPVTETDWGVASIRGKLSLLLAVRLLIYVAAVPSKDPHSESAY
jgi:hypothetical protein